jgi:PhnB protein
MKGINTYLIFDGNCKEAMTFYAKCLGGELSIMPFSDVPGGTPSSKEEVMHSCLTVGSAAIMGSDSMPNVTVRQGNNFSVAVQCESAEEIEKFFAALSENGKVTVPLQDVFWGSRFGELTDQFGVQWMFNYPLPKKE